MGPSAVVVRPLDQASVLITGGTSGVGFETALEFVRAGVPRIAINGRDRERGEKARTKLVQHAAGSITVEFLAGDASDPGSAQRLVELAASRLGTVDVLVNCAGGDHMPSLLHELAITDIQPVLDYCLSTSVLMSKAVLEIMYAARGGAIINVASDAAKVATPGESVIGAAMAGIVMFSRTLALEAKRSGVRVNAVTPSLIRGTRTYDRINSKPFSTKLFEKAARAAHLGVVTAQDVAPLIVFLASPAAARLTGQAISVNGGISAA